MKGIVFTEFLELVENKFGLEMVDTIILNSNLKSNGVYTSVGTYSFSEMLQLLTHLSEKTGISIDDLLLIYGEHFFEVLKNNYPELLDAYTDPMELISSIENHIHVEVKKIYPDALRAAPATAPGVGPRTMKTTEKGIRNLVKIVKN